MVDLFQVHLSGKRCSGRAVKFRSMSPAEVDKVNSDAAKAAGDKANVIDWLSIKGRLGTKRMIVAVTVKDKLAEKDLPTAQWREVSEQTLDSEWESLFTAKDHGVLVALYRQYHEINEEELSHITGKVLSVAQ